MRTPSSDITQSTYNTFIKRADTTRKYQEEAHIKQDPFWFQFKKLKKKHKKIQYHKNGRIEHAYKEFIKHTYN